MNEPTLWEPVRLTAEVFSVGYGPPEAPPTHIRLWFSALGVLMSPVLRPEEAEKLAQAILLVVDEFRKRDVAGTVPEASDAPVSPWDGLGGPGISGTGFVSTELIDPEAWQIRSHNLAGQPCPAELIDPILSAQVSAGLNAKVDAVTLTDSQIYQLYEAANAADTELRDPEVPF